METSDGTTRRDVLRSAVFLAAGAGMPRDAQGGGLGDGEAMPRARASAIGRGELLAGLDGLSRVADEGHDSFVEGHAAAAVIATTFFCRENELDDGTQKALVALVRERLLVLPIFAPRPEEPADPELAAGLVEDLHERTDSLRGSGHDIVFTALALAALREIPEAATPARVHGLRAMVRSFGPRGRPAPSVEEPLPDPGDPPAFARFVLEEYLRVLELYLGGRGHHGFAGHVLTIGHALRELHRLGHAETARKGLGAYALFLGQARAGADLGGSRVPAPPPDAPRPLERDYWVTQARRPTDLVVSAHLVKYPYSFYALRRELDDEELEQRLERQLYHLTAVS